MLTHLVVDNLGPLAHAEIALGPGCTVLTGETGAGKTLIVTALQLLAGGRADRTLVRAGESESVVEGRFLVPSGHASRAILAAHGLGDDPGGDQEVIVSRVVPADGRGGTARLNGRLVAVGFLQELARTLVEIVGQDSRHRLGSPGWRRWLLDSFAGPDALALAARVTDALRSAARLRRRLEELEGSERERERELDVLRYELAEIDAADVADGEEEAVRAEAHRLERAEVVGAAVGGALEQLDGEAGIVAKLDAAGAELRRSGDDDLAGVVERLASLSLEAGDIAGELRRRLVEPDPDALDAVRERLAVIGRLKRKYGRDWAAVRRYAAEARSRVAELEAAAEDAGVLEDQLRAETTRAAALAGKLSSLRREAAPRLERSVERLLAELGMAGAGFRVRLDERELYEGGAEAVELLLAAAPGEPAVPAAKAASGGELARLSLALFLVASAPGVTTMVFDEVDAGVGGGAARAVGRLLAELARTRAVQVLVVTHLPQVAAFADEHHRVAKTVAEGRATAGVARLAGEDRVVELSRMLAGLPESDRAREHAQELLELAGGGT